MDFAAKRRKPPVVPIIPLLDILAILLIFFVATSTFREENPAVNITPPTSTALAAKMVEDERVTLALTAEGDVYLGADQVDLDDLAVHLLDFKEERPAAELQLKADENVPLKTMVEVWDSLTAAGFDFKNVPTRILLQRAQ
ncbi:MAG: biopolymer transporter ExbD [Verrucomicrobiota bacterium]